MYSALWSHWGGSPTFWSHWDGSGDTWPTETMEEPYGSSDIYSLGLFWKWQTCWSLFHLWGHSFLFLMDNVFVVR